MNFYPIDFEEQHSQQLIHEPLIEQTNESQYYEYEQSAQQEPEQLNTFDGYLQEEPVLLFNYVEEAPKKKTKHVIRKSKKIRKVDSETDVPSKKSLKSHVTNNDVLKLQQCQRLKTIISQMEAFLQQTRASILKQYINNHTK
ncbi:unnamed protein product (macronuclear) [Paramecium tetraurelia]|uniref:Uncharacterized protein n=1 Tax=Paramecium tetraurelia TaxID=5888 RepID=A0BJ70_PARTE|nr:uncharacterized protein GSPATT00004960001 [Paramecium tetraurelia]CAK58587.1 unnamed protein product [Paramecium tetraurelia]|eukprot:XP_001425985.1 hypothetical protein (macronuclear) [Paramecium tetraurelia strain d4-2]